MALVRVSTQLEAAPEKVWNAVQSYSTLRHVMRGLIGFAGSMPDRVQAGDSVDVRLWFFHLLPAWRHTIGIEAVNAPLRTIQSRETGGLVKRWDHLIRVSPGREGQTDYTDEIEIEAGVFTPLVCLWAHAQYRYRQWRWRAFAKLLEGRKG